MRARVRFSTLRPGGDRVHYVNEEDVRVVLGRLPAELLRRLRAVHFNDRNRGGFRLGYVNRGRREIALCALPPRVALTSALVMGQSAEEFGARPNRKWPPLAVRRLMLYDVLLHEVGHLQPVAGRDRSARLRFARERLAEEFAAEWRARLWSAHFTHPDPVHNPPADSEMGETVGQ